MDEVVDDAQVLCERLINEYITMLTDENEMWLTEPEVIGERLTKILDSAKNQILDLTMNMPKYDIPNKTTNTKIATKV